MSNGFARRVGTTSKQIKAAEASAIYVCVFGSILYTRALAKRLGREDLDICSEHVLANFDKFRGKGANVPFVVVDHAVRMTPEMQEILMLASYERRKK